MCTRKVSRTGPTTFMLTAAALISLSARLPAEGAQIFVDPVQGAGFVEVDALTLLGIPVGSPFELDVVFTDMQFIQVDSSATMQIGFGVGNTGNSFGLDYRLVFDLTDAGGNLFTLDLIVQEETVDAGVTNLNLRSPTPLPDHIAFHGFRISVETGFAGGEEPGMFDGYDLFVARGASEPQVFGGPITVNRAVVIPEPSSLALLGIAGLGLLRRRRRRVLGLGMSAAIHRPDTQRSMTSSHGRRTRWTWAGVGLGLCWAGSSAGAALMDLSVSVQDSEGVVLESDTTRIVQGVQESGRAMVRDPSGEMLTFIDGTFNAAAIAEAVVNVDPKLPPHLLANWVTKTEVLISNYGWNLPGAVTIEVSSNHQFTRDLEKYAIFAIPPDSTGAVVVDGEATGLNILRFEYSIRFLVSDTPSFAPSMTFGSLLTDWTLFDTIADINTGHELIVNLDHWAAPGETYSFEERYRLQASLDNLVLFANDPVAGTAIPEPMATALLVLSGGTLLKRRCATRSPARQDERYFAGVNHTNFGDACAPCHGPRGAGRLWTK